MKLEHGPQRRRQKAGEILDITPEGEQPLEIDFEKVVDQLESSPEIAFDKHTALLLGLIGGQPLKRLRPKLFKSYKRYADEGDNALLLENYPGSSLDETATWLAVCKLWKPKLFGRLGINMQEKKAALWEELPFNQKGTEPYSNVVGYLVLFPEDRDQILKEVLETEDYLVEHAEKQFNNSFAWSFTAMACLKILRPDNKAIAAFARKKWLDVRLALEGALKTINETTDREEVESEAAYALELGLSMYILATEKIVINNKGLLEVTPAKKKLAARPALPDRPLS